MDVVAFADWIGRMAARLSSGWESAMTDQARVGLMSQHVAARRRRDAAPLDSAGYREASEEVARIEIAIAAAEEPTPVISAAATPTEGHGAR